MNSNSIKGVKNVASNGASRIKERKLSEKQEAHVNLHNVPRKSVSLASLGSLSANGQNRIDGE